MFCLYRGFAQEIFLISLLIIKQIEIIEKKTPPKKRFELSRCTFLTKIAVN